MSVIDLQHTLHINVVTYDVSISFKDVNNRLVLFVPEKDVSAVTSANYIFGIGSKKVDSLNCLPVSVEI